ncbi:hypothetical protein FHS12_001271 [Nocardioides albus]|uniref:Uncharacterized protein n=1 Tax=Nocardioides albus TaxID=1841 RepID=A0A7W5A2M6_9ACTN|nr:hypothetical protein [Nocardioides albus]
MNIQITGGEVALAHDHIDFLTLPPCDQVVGS